MAYQKRPTQEQRILDLLKERGGKGVAVWEFMLPRNQGGLGVAQYNARVYSLRKKGYDIKNTKPGHFVLKTEKPRQGELLNSDVKLRYQYEE